MEPKPKIEGRPFVAYLPGAGASRRADAPLSETATQSGPTGPDTDPGSLIDLLQLADYLRFVAGSVRRHWMLGAAILLLGVAATGGLAVIWPKTYHVQAKLLAQRNEVMAALSNPGRAIPWDADAPTRAAAETVLRHDNLVALIKQTNLMERWTQTRAPILRVKDTLTASIFREHRTEEEKLDAMVGLLETRLIVTTGSAIDGTVTIDINWPDPRMVYELVQAAQHTFLVARQLAETSAITESIDILERNSATLHEEINRTVAEQQEAQARKPSSSRTSKKPTTASALPLASSLPSVSSILSASTASAGLDNNPELVRLKAALATKREEVKGLEEQHQRQLMDLQTRLTQLRMVYTDSHPAVLDLQQTIASVSAESPRLLALRAEEQRLAADYDRRLALASSLLDESARNLTLRTPEAKPLPATSERPTSLPNDPTADYSTLRFKLQINQLQGLLDRIDGARIELAVSQAAFKYRYTVIRPAQVPRRPVKPNLGAILAAGVVGAFGLALMAVVAMDLLSGRILQTWQLERQLGLPALGVMRTL